MHQTIIQINWFFWRPSVSVDMILFVVELQRLLYLYGLVNSRSAGYVPVVAGERQA